jgi:hypothetical protein
MIPPLGAKGQNRRFSIAGSQPRKTKRIVIPVRKEIFTLEILRAFKSENANNSMIPETGNVSSANA